MFPFRTMPALDNEKIAVIGLGYVGLPVAISFGRKLPTIGFDIRQRRVDELKAKLAQSAGQRRDDAHG